MLLEVSSSASSLSAGIAEVAFVTARKSWCERWVSDEGASNTRVAVTGRELRDRPYELLVQPTHFTDLSAPIHAWALGLNQNGALVAVADFGEHPFVYKSVNKYKGVFQSFARHGSTAGYVTSDGCLCAPGLPRIGNGTGTGCDLDVVSSLPRLIDTAGCELGPDENQLTKPVCDGQDYGDGADRLVPCFAKRGSDGCSVAVRTCHDRDSIGFMGTCAPEATAPLLPSAALCDAYSACENNPCGDIDRCFRTTAPRTTDIHCTLRVSVENTGKVQLCNPTATSPLPPANATACLAILLGGQKQAPLTMALTGTGQPEGTTSCPPTLGITAIDAVHSELPPQITFDMMIGDKLARVVVAFAIGCNTAGGGDAFSCQ